MADATLARAVDAAFDPFDPFDAVVDKGEVKFEGKTAHKYEWKDKILKIITMQSSDLWVDDAVPTNPKPLKLTSTLGVSLPFGIGPHLNLGTQVNTWQFWTPGTPAAAKFDIKGVDTCKMSSKCQSPSMQAHRARRGDLYTFYSHVTA